MITVKCRVQGETLSEVVGVRDLPPGQSVLVKYDENGMHVYTLASDDAAIDSLSLTLVDEKDPQ